MSQKFIAAAVLSACASVASAAEPQFSFSGFGTVGVTQTNTNEAEFARPGQTHGATKRPSLGVDSRIGLQGDAKFNQMFSASVQVLTEQNGRGDWDPQLQSAFIRADLGQGVKFRAGRINPSVFALSDFRAVGYAQLWVRPPNEVYSQVPMNHFDGLDLSYTKTLGETVWRAQVFGGVSSSYTQERKADLKNIVGANLSASYGPVTARAVYGQADLSVTGGELAELLAAVKPIPGLVEALQVQDRRTSFTGVSLEYDRDEIVANAEYTRRRSGGALDSSDAWFVSLGYRINAFTPYVSYAAIDQKSKSIRQTINDYAPGMGDMMVNGLGRTRFNALGQNTTSLGVRWDVVKNVALKAQYDRVRIDNGGTGLFVNPVRGFDLNTVHVGSVVVDFVF